MDSNKQTNILVCTFSPTKEQSRFIEKKYEYLKLKIGRSKYSYLPKV